MRHVLPLTACLLAGCAAPSWMPDMPAMPDLVPDFSSWFNPEHAIEVQEVSRADICNTPDSESAVTVMPDPAALQAWAQSRGVRLEPDAGRPLPQTSFAVVEYGQRPHGGYGLAVSKQGGLRNSVLLLKGTFFEPAPGRWASTTPMSPCVVVSLPPRNYKDIKVLDQTGRVRAARDG